MTNEELAQKFLSETEVGYTNKTWKKLTALLGDAAIDGTCDWMYSDPDYGGWASMCGSEFRFEDGSPTENGMVRCCNCGKKIIETLNPNIDYENNEWIV